jgi:hypothetical protein
MIISGVTLIGVTVVDGQLPITENLQVYLSPDSYSGTGTTWTDSQGQASATLSGAPTYDAATGFTFNGTTQYARMPSVDGVTNFNNNNNYTVEVWFNPSSGQSSATLATVLEKWNSTNQGRYPYVFRYNESIETIGISVYDGVNNPGSFMSGIDTDTWHQVVGVFDFNTDELTGYHNGSADTSTSLAGVGTVSNTSQVGLAHRIPSGGSGTQFLYKGSIGVIRIYDRALASSEILQNFNATRDRYSL